MRRVIPIRNVPEVLTQYVKAMRGAGLSLRQALSITHWTSCRSNPLVLKPCPFRGCEADLLEGACVVAAHQFLTLHGECGFVDPEATESEVPDTERRIAAFQSLGGRHSPLFEFKLEDHGITNPGPFSHRPIHRSRCCSSSRDTTVPIPSSSSPAAGTLPPRLTADFC